jgi:hypothetical protein
MEKENRKYRRFCVEQDRVQVSVSDTQKFLTVRDVSRGGIKLEYNPRANGIMESEMIDIIAMNHYRIFVPKMSCETVYDLPTLMQDSSFRGREVRIRGLKFLDLTEEQENGLKQLIDKLIEHYSNTSAS